MYLYLLKFVSCRTGRKAEIVIDAQSCYNLWCNPIDIMFGFGFQEFVHNLKCFVDSFQKIGAKLVFFLGGLTPEKKRKTWVNRRIKNMEDILSVFDSSARTNLSPDISKHFNYIPTMPHVGFVVSFILKYILKCEVNYFELLREILY